MLPLKETTVYDLISVKDELPTANWWYWVYVNGIPERRSVFFYGATNGWYNDNDCLKPFYKPVSHWLKPQKSYLLSKDRLIELLANAFNSGQAFGPYHLMPTSFSKSANKEEYLKELGL